MHGGQAAAAAPDGAADGLDDDDVSHGRSLGRLLVDGPGLRERLAGPFEAPTADFARLGVEAPAPVGRLEEHQLVLGLAHTPMMTGGYDKNS